MRITIFNLKGGQGKTTVTLALALSAGFLVVTNDEYSPIDRVLKQGNFMHLAENEALPDNVPDSVDLVYDFGGRPDSRVIEAVKLSDFLIVPVVYDSPLDMQTTISAITELEQHTKNIIIVVNRTRKDDFKVSQAVLRQYFNYPTFEVKESTAFVKMVEQAKSIDELCENNVLLAYHYKKPLEQVRAIQAHISKAKK